MFINTEHDTESDKRIKIKIYITKHTINTNTHFQKSKAFKRNESLQIFQKSFYYVSKLHDSYLIYFVRQSRGNHHIQNQGNPPYRKA